MDRRRTRFMCDEKEDNDRRISSRNRKRARYIEDDEEDSEQPGPSTQNTHNQGTQENNLPVYAELKGLLLVTCQNRNGFLDVEKLSRGQDCIRCEDRWFTPSAFEDFAGKGSSKKWKTSIFYENEPLQFWFEQGHLTTKGYKRRGSETTKQKKAQSSNYTSDSSSEESEKQSAEDTEEDDVADDDWLPSSEELGLEPEEESVGPENGRQVVDSGVEQSKEEEDKTGKREMEDEDTPSVADDSRVFEEREANLRSPTRERSVFQKEVKVVIKRLREAKSDCQSDDKEHPLGVGWCEPLDKHALNEEDGEHSPAIDDTATTHSDCSQMSDPPITQSNGRKVIGIKNIGTQTRHSPTSGPATSSPDTKPEIEDIASTSNRPANLSSSVVLSVALTDTGFDGNTTGVAPPTKPKIVLDEGNYENTDAASSGHEAAQLQAMELEKRAPQTAQTSLITQTSSKVEAPSSSDCDLDAMDLDQLKREKIKMQITVLKLQEEYYTQKLKGQKKLSSFTRV